eukprot:389507-Lingulodinium_polyedra.AAC.1
MSSVVQTAHGKQPQLALHATWDLRPEARIATTTAHGGQTMADKPIWAASHAARTPGHAKVLG